jgi:ACT domain-containing protein
MATKEETKKKYEKAKAGLASKKFKTVDQACEKVRMSPASFFNYQSKEKNSGISGAKIHTRNAPTPAPNGGLKKASPEVSEEVRRLKAEIFVLRQDHDKAIEDAVKLATKGLQEEVQKLKDKIVKLV